MSLGDCSLQSVLATGANTKLKMKYFICCQIALVFISLTVLTESTRFGILPQLSPQLRIGRANKGFMYEFAHSTFTPMIRVGKSDGENLNNDQNDEAPKLGVNRDEFLPHIRTGRTNFQDFDRLSKNSSDFAEDYQKMNWYYWLMKELFQQDPNSSNSSEKDK